MKLEVYHTTLFCGHPILAGTCYWRNDDLRLIRFIECVKPPTRPLTYAEIINYTNPSRMMTVLTFEVGWIVLGRHHEPKPILFAHPGSEPEYLPYWTAAYHG